MTSVSAPTKPLYVLAQEKFPDCEFTQAEWKLLKELPRGESVVIAEGKDPRVTNTTWEEEETIHADLLAWVLSTPIARPFFTINGLKLSNALIEGILDLRSLEFHHTLWLIDCSFNQDVYFNSASVLDLILNRSSFTSLIAQGIEAKGNIFLDEIHATNFVSLAGAKTEGQLSANGAHFLNNNDNKHGVFNAECLEAKGGIFLGDLYATGSIRFFGAKTEGQFNASNAQLLYNSEDGQEALNAEALEAKGAIILRDIRATGAIRFVGAKTDGQLLATGAHFLFNGSNDLAALDAQGLLAKGGIILNEITVAGELYLCKVTCESVFLLANVNSQESNRDYSLDFRHAQVEVLLDDSLESWPYPGNLRLDGLRYKGIADNSGLSFEDRFKWLRRRPDDKFLPQPYQQLAKVYRESGHRSQAKDVLVAMEEDRALYYRRKNKEDKAKPKKDRTYKLRIYDLLWYVHGWGTLIGYGYRPERALKYAFYIILIGCGVFLFAHNAQLMMPTSEKPHSLGDYPAYHAIIYSLDTFVPILNLYQVQYWFPETPWGEPIQSWGFWKRVGLLIWFWFEIIAGWVLTSLFVLGLTGIVKQEE